MTVKESNHIMNVIKTTRESTKTGSGSQGVNAESTNFGQVPWLSKQNFFLIFFLLNWTTYVLFQFKVVGLFISLVHLLHDTKQISVLIYIYTVIIIYYYVNTNKIKFFLNQVLYDVEIYLYLKVLNRYGNTAVVRKCSQ